jgi:pyruvate kinase
MNKILLTAESYLAATLTSPSESRFTISEAVASSALSAAEKASAKAIIVYSVHGHMATLVSKGRPRCPVIVVTPSEETAKKMRLFYATYPIVLHFGKYSEVTVASAEEEILSQGLLSPSDTVIMCSGVVPNLPGLTNITKIYKIGEYLGVLASVFKK